MSIGWILVFIAGAAEIVFVLSLKLNEGFTKLWPSVLTAVSALLSFGCLSQAIKTIPIGTAYAVWCGMGILGIAVIGIIFFQEPSNWVRIVCILAILLGIIGLKLVA
jgi:quaternary ammonium compound-resistance protein SugE